MSTRGSDWKIVNGHVHQGFWLEDCQWLCPTGVRTGRLSMAVSTRGSDWKTVNGYVHQGLWLEDCQWLCPPGVLTGRLSMDVSTRGSNWKTVNGYVHQVTLSRPELFMHIPSDFVTGVKQMWYLWMTLLLTTGKKRLTLNNIQRVADQRVKLSKEKKLGIYIIKWKEMLIRFGQDKLACMLTSVVPSACTLRLAGFQRPEEGEALPYLNLVGNVPMIDPICLAYSNPIGSLFMLNSILLILSFYRKQSVCLYHI